MLKRDFLNFVKGLKFYLTPYGAILFFLVFGLTIAIIIGLPLVIIMMVVLDVNSQNYVDATIEAYNKKRPRVSRIGDEATSIPARFIRAFSFFGGLIRI